MNLFQLENLLTCDACCCSAAPNWQSDPLAVSRIEESPEFRLLLNPDIHTWMIDTREINDFPQILCFHVMPQILG